MSDRTNATIRHILAQWERIIRGALARAEANRQRIIMEGFRAFQGWLNVRPKRLKARRNWDYLRAFGIPTARHFLSYEKKGHYGWGGEYARNPLRAGNPVNYFTPPPPGRRGEITIAVAVDGIEVRRFGDLWGRTEVGPMPGAQRPMELTEGRIKPESGV